MTTYPVLTFLAGVLAGLALVAAWQGVRFLIDLRAVRRRALRLGLESAREAPLEDPRDVEAQRLVAACKARLMFQRRLNPQWVTPLVREIPDLVRAIAATYYPDRLDPLWAPGISRFSRAVELTARDIADFLENQRVGRLVDVSAHTVRRTWDVGYRLSKHEHWQAATRWYQRVRPVWQAARYRSPITWVSLAATNAAVRVLQPAIVAIVARRAIELYSGRPLQS
jgi:hypothetical protein